MQLTFSNWLCSCAFIPMFVWWFSVFCLCVLCSVSVLCSLARTVVKAPKSCHITPILRSIHWLRITECIEYKLLSLTYKVLTTTQPLYLYYFISIQRPRSTDSSSVVTLARPPSSSYLKITDCSFHYVSGISSLFLFINLKGWTDWYYCIVILRRILMRFALED